MSLITYLHPTTQACLRNSVSKEMLIYSIGVEKGSRGGVLGFM